MVQLGRPVWVYRGLCELTGAHIVVSWGYIHFRQRVAHVQISVTHLTSSAMTNIWCVCFFCTQLTGLGRQRSQRLTNGLADLRRSNQLLEELLAWLNGAEVTLTEVERQPIPEDMAIIQQLLKEHQVSQVSLSLIHI